MKNVVSPFPSVDLIFIHFVPVCQDWMSGEEVGVIEALSSQTLERILLCSPFIPQSTLPLFLISLHFLYACFFPSHHSLLSLLSQLLLLVLRYP